MEHGKISEKCNRDPIHSVTTLSQNCFTVQHISFFYSGRYHKDSRYRIDSGCPCCLKIRGKPISSWGQKCLFYTSFHCFFVDGVQIHQRLWVVSCQINLSQPHLFHILYHRKGMKGGGGNPLHVCHYKVLEDIRSITILNKYSYFQTTVVPWWKRGKQELENKAGVWYKHRKDFFSFQQDHSNVAYTSSYCHPVVGKEHKLNNWGGGEKQASFPQRLPKDTRVCLWFINSSWEIDLWEGYGWVWRWIL